MDFDISPNAPTPIYRQIVEQVRRMVASGQLAPGDALPSVRAVAQHHAINPMTVSKAYSLLETEQLVVRLRGVGMAIADAGVASPHAAKLDMLRPALDAAARTARQLGLADADAIALFHSSLAQLTEKEKHD
jgi:GntR family transcriptional regulator